MRALEAGVDALLRRPRPRRGRCRPDPRGARRRVSDESRLREAAGRIARLADWAQPVRGARRPRGAGAGAAPGARCVEGDVALRAAPRDRRAAPAREHRRRRGRARRSATRPSSARASRSRTRTCTSCATRTGIRGCGRRPTCPARSSSRPGCRSGGRRARAATSRRTAAAARRYEAVDGAARAV